MTPRLLLVEDDPTSRAFLVAASEALPASVDAAGSIASAIGLATTHDYALWVVDANLPDGTGASLLAELRRRGLRTPAIAHTAAHAPADLDALLDAGFVDAISKPVSTDAWQATLRRVLDGQVAERPGAYDAAIAAVAAADAPLWDDAAALAAMNHNRANVDALRALFLAELPATRNAVDEAFRAGDAVALSTALHRLRAGCGFVGAKRLDALAAALRDAPRSPAAHRDFLAALQDTLSS